MRENGVVQISREDLTKHYASLSDEELLTIDDKEITEMALDCFFRELKRRKLPWPVDSGEDADEFDTRGGTAPDWLETAVTAFSFLIGQRPPEDAERACRILSEAGIPSYVVSEHEDGSRYDYLTVMVPGTLNLKALSVLDRDLFNEEAEESWRAHFEELSDAELRSLSAADLCAGLLDRAVRLKRVYEEAVARRNESRA